MAVTLTDAELLDQFEAGTLPSAQFPHREHVRVAWLFIQRHGMPAALSAFSAALQRFARTHGAPMLYHATITWAYLFLIHARQQACAARDWETFAADNPDLMCWKPSILERYYTAETLWSDRARHTFVLPDRGLRLADEGVGSA